MKELICTNTMLPLRIRPSHKSEMGSQVLFGEKYIILDNIGNWLKIKTNFDGYEGWIDNDHHLSNHIINIKGSSKLITERIQCYTHDNKIFVIEPGSEVYAVSNDLKSFTLGYNSYTVKDKLPLAPLDESLIATAERFLNSPYLWGGRVPSGIDCSGFTQLVYKLHGKSLPRDSFWQAETGKAVSFIEEAKPGDLLFFDNTDGIIDHTGILYEKGKVIHCSGRVRVDVIDHQGIFRPDIDTYSHKLRLIKRIIK